MFNGVEEDVVGFEVGVDGLGVEEFGDIVDIIVFWVVVEEVCFFEFGVGGVDFDGGDIDDVEVGVVVGLVGEIIDDLLSSMLVI